MTTSRQDREFAAELMPDGNDWLGKAIDWIKINMNPEDVFDKDTLNDWAVDNGWVPDEE